MQMSVSSILHKMMCVLCLLLNGCTQMLLDAIVVDVVQRVHV